jgi:putative transposase
MARKLYPPERVAEILKEIEIAVGRGMSVEHACLDAGIGQQTYYRWKVKYAGLSASQVRQIELLRRENLQLKRLVKALRQEKSILQSVLAGMP